jgi:hypothetical protein
MNIELAKQIAKLNRLIWIAHKIGEFVNELNAIVALSAALNCFFFDCFLRRYFNRFANGLLSTPRITNLPLISR